MNAAIRALVLSPVDWPKYTTYPLYGMPHYLDAQTLVIAGQNNSFWQSLTPPLETLPPTAASAMRAAYGQADSSLDLSPFFDLLAVHEMGHLYHSQASRQFPRLWLMELFCNLSLHAYVVAEEPERLSQLEAFPRMICGMGHSHLQYHTLADFERLYVNVGPQNYGWYQCQLHNAAQRIYNAGGIEALQRLWDVPITFDGESTDEELASQLENEVHPEVAQVLISWP
jgi:hypothetical protein